MSYNPFLNPLLNTVGKASLYNAYQKAEKPEDKDQLVQLMLHEMPEEAAAKVLQARSFNALGNMIGEVIFSLFSKNKKPA